MLHWARQSVRQWKETVERDAAESPEVNNGEMAGAKLSELEPFLVQFGVAPSIF